MIKQKLKNIDSKRETIVEVADCVGIYNYTIYSPLQRLLGRSIVMVQVVAGKNGKPVERYVMLDIVVYHEKDRRQGIATELLNVITNSLPSIITMAPDAYMRQLLYKYGFKPVSGATNFLYYERKDGKNANGQNNNEKKSNN